MAGLEVLVDAGEAPGVGALAAGAEVLVTVGEASGLGEAGTEVVATGPIPD